MKSIKEMLRDIARYYTTAEGKEYLISLAAYTVACIALGAGLAIVILQARGVVI